MQMKINFCALLAGSILSAVLLYNMAGQVWGSGPSGKVVGTPNVVLDESAVLRLSVNSIRITVSDDRLAFKVENVGRFFDGKKIIEFLGAFYTRSKVRRTNDIIVTSTTKRLVEGEREFDKALRVLSKRHKINVVYLPVATGSDPNQELKDFSDNFKS